MVRLYIESHIILRIILDRLKTRITSIQLKSIKYGQSNMSLWNLKNKLRLDKKKLNLKIKKIQKINNFLCLGKIMKIYEINYID